MSDAQSTAAPETAPLVPVAVPSPAPVPGAPAAPAKPLTAIQVIEQEIMNYIRQREQAIANIHAVEGAIQGAQNLLAKLKAEEAKAVAFVKKEVAQAVAEVQETVAEVKAAL